MPRKIVVNMVISKANHSKNKKLFSMTKHAGNYRRRIEEKAKVVAAVRGTEFMIQFLAALQI